MQPYGRAPPIPAEVSIYCVGEGTEELQEVRLAINRKAERGKTSGVIPSTGGERELGQEPRDAGHPLVSRSPPEALLGCLDGC